MNIVLLFCLLSLANVIISTIKSILTVKGGKWLASISNATYYAFYNIVIIYTVADFPMWEKCAITFACNIVGVFIVKFIEEKMRKDKLWVYQATCKEDSQTIKTIRQALEDLGVKSLYSEIVPNQLYSLQVFAYTQKESTMVQGVLKNYDVKYCALESKCTQ